MNDVFMHRNDDNWVIMEDKSIILESLMGYGTLLIHSCWQITRTLILLFMTFTLRGEKCI